MPLVKRLGAGFLLFLIGLNTIGYYGILLLAQRQLTSQIREKIENNANELNGNLILSIPFILPYASDAEEYTRLDGEIVMGGEVYRFVKQKLHQGVLYVVCVKDDQSSRAREVMSEYTRAFSGQQQEQGNSAIKMLSSLAKYYVVIDPATRTDKDERCIIFNPQQFSNLYCFTNVVSVFHPPQFS